MPYEILMKWERAWLGQPMVSGTLDVGETACPASAARRDRRGVACDRLPRKPDAGAVGVCCIISGFPDVREAAGSARGTSWMRDVATRGAALPC